MKIRYGLLLGLVATCLVGGWSAWYLLKTAPQTTNSRLSVVAAENFWGDILQQIGGSTVKVETVMSDPSVDPHTYESSAHDALVVSRARLLITNGLGYDSFMDKLAGATPNDKRTTLIVAKILSVPDKNANPHLWYDLNRVPEVATAFEKQLAGIDPVHTANYETNLRTFLKTLQPLQDKQNSIASEFGGTSVAYTERLPQYMLENMKLLVKTPEEFSTAVEDGNDPSPAAQSSMLDLIRRRQVKMLLYNTQASSPVTERIRSQARQAGVQVVGISETMPRNTHFQEWQLSQLNAIQNALQ